MDKKYIDIEYIKLIDAALEECQEQLTQPFYHGARFILDQIYEKASGVEECQNCVMR